MQRLTVFISSTVKDFGPIRADLRTWLTRQQADVRTSEATDFPVDDSVTSHDACLRALEGCHLAVVLIGTRYGGSYAGTPKSITQREYEEAFRQGIPTIVLVLKEVTTKAEQWAKRLLTRPPFEEDTHAIVDFLNLVRKGHVNNWIHPDWDGTLYQAREIIQSRINTLFVRYQQPHRETVERLKRLPQYSASRLKLDQLVRVLETQPDPAQDKLALLLTTVADQRTALLGYEEADRWNFAIYKPSHDETCLGVFVRMAHPNIVVSNREWKVGEGHVGSCWQLGSTLVAADLTVTGSWVGARPGDEENNYRSAVAEPILDHEDRVKAILVATSSRLDHFRDAQQPEVTTLGSLALFVSRLI